MGYAVDYVPTRERRKIKKKYRREHVTSKAVRARDMRNAVRWNLPTLEHDTTGTATVDRSIVINLLRLDRISPTADPTGDHAMQQLVSEGIVKLTVSQAARYLHVSRRTMQRMRDQGTGPAYFRSGEAPNSPILYELADLDMWLAARKER